MFTSKPTKDQVLKELAKYSKLHLEKAKFHLAMLIQGKKCYCIEGVFCEIASNLGLPGEYVLQTDDTGSIYQFRLDVNGPQSDSECIAPEEIWSFLGLPTTVKTGFVAGLGERYADALVNSEVPVYMSKSHNRAKWFTYNDQTDLTIPELLKIAEKVLEQGDA